VRKDGTSSATPIAAGIAALFIEYCRHNKLQDPGSHENILKLFSAMSAETSDTYRLLRPWTLLDKKKVEDTLKSRKTENKTSLKMVKGSFAHYSSLIFISDTDGGVRVLLENMEGIVSFFVFIDSSQRTKRTNCLNGFLLTMKANGMRILVANVPKAQVDGF
jgi:hypothetical protein